MRNDGADLTDDQAYDTAMCAMGFDDRHPSDMSDDLLLDTIDVMRADDDLLVPVDMATEAFGRGFLLRL